MATIKSFTDLPQSKVLAEFLPIESADMCFNISQRSNMPPLMTPYSKFNEFFNMETPDFLIPCWSLAALLGVLSEEVALNSFIDGNWNAMVQQNGKMIYSDANNPVDACYEMIIKLHELNLL